MISSPDLNIPDRWGVDIFDPGVVTEDYIHQLEAVDHMDSVEVDTDLVEDIDLVVDRAASAGADTVAAEDTREVVPHRAEQEEAGNQVAAEVRIVPVAIDRNP